MVDVLGHARVFPPSLFHGLLEGHNIDVFYPATVHGEVVSDVLQGDLFYYVVAFFKRLNHVSSIAPRIRVQAPRSADCRRR